jgi:hypothetical protein
MEHKPNEVKTITWHLVAKNLVKFVNDEKTYKLTDKVIAANDFVKYPLSKGTQVEVGILNDTITFLRKQKSEAPKAESHGSEEAYEPTPEEEAGPTPKVEQKVEPLNSTPVLSNGTTNAKELTIYAIAANKKVVKFTEIKDDGWFQIAENIQAQDYKVIGLEAKNRVKVTFNDKLVTSLVRVTSEPAETTKTGSSSPDNAKSEPMAGSAVQTPVQAPKKEWVPYKSQDTDARQNSIECQAMINSACEIVGQVAASVSPAPTASVINNMVRAIATENYNLLQELKKK